MKMLSKALIELFGMIDVSYNKEKINYSPIKYYDALRTMILESNLKDSEKLKYSKYLE
jgi:hypothetical protein